MNTRATLIPPVPFRIVLLVWSVVASAAVLQAVVQYAMIGALEREWRTAVLQFPRWIAWAFVTPGVVALTRRLPLRGPTRGRALLAHVACAVLLTVTLEAAWTQLAIALEPPRARSAYDAQLTAWRAVISPIGRLLVGAITYTALVAAITAIEAMHRTQQLLSHSVALERDLAVARVQAIKMQVHPHFLFNTLNTVSVLIDEEPSVAREMVGRLADMLRATLSRASVTEVVLQQELDLVGSYLAIEGVRFRDRLTVTFDIGSGLSDALVPDLILQPLADNAIKHGIAECEGNHRIDVRARAEGDTLVLEVLDEGVGVRHRRLSGQGVGLATVRDRLRQLYGLEDCLTLILRPGGGTCARITLPLRR